MTTIQLTDVVKDIKGKRIIDHVSLQMESGKISGLKGVNGSGKTMLMRLIAGLITPTSGSILINGKRLGKDITFPESIGILIENPAFLDAYSGFDNLKMLASIQKKITDDHIRETLSLVGLDPYDKKKYRKYSLGMKQRLGIAMALLGSPKLLVLDEPANALDAAGMKQVRDLLRTLCRDWGTTVFLSSHLLSEVEQIADTVGILHRGRLLREISLSELAAQSLTYIELVTPDVRAAARVLEELGVRRFKVLQEGVVRIYEAPMAPEELSRALALQNVAIASFQKHADTLEDYYLRLTGEEN